MKYYLFIIFSIIVINVAFPQQKAENLRMLACDGDLTKLESHLADGIDINIRDRRGRTLLHYATACNQEKVFDYVIEKGIDVNIEDKRGFSPLLLAILRGNPNIVKKLLTVGAKANFNYARQGGTTILMEIILRNNLSTAKLLIENGADVNATNKRGNTPLGIAKREGLDDMVALLIKNGAHKEGAKTPEPEGEYMGELKPGTKAKMFAPNFISTESPVQNGIFHPNGKEFYFTMDNRGTIMLSKMIDGKWTKPIPVPIPSQYRKVGPFITRDGSRLYYSSNRPAKESDSPTRNMDMWYLERDGDTWGAPIYLGSEVNSESTADWFPTISDNGRLYFFRYRKNGSGDIFYSEKKNDKYQEAVFVEGIENNKYHNYDPFIAPDESYIIFASRRPDGLGQDDLYICYRDDAGKWSKAKNMGSGINSKKSEYAPLLTPDGKYLFFARGHGDIFWVDAQIIKEISNKKITLFYRGSYKDVPKIKLL